MRHLTLAEVLELHRRLVDENSGSHGIRDLGMLEFAVAQPLGSFGGQDFYASVAEKAAAFTTPLR